MITVPKPCSENWDAMQELEKSRFCTTCQKCVIDFTILSDSEILKIINTKNANLCGRFNEKQINRVLKTPNTYNIRYTKTFFSLTLASFLGFQNHIHAKPFLKTHIEQLSKKDETLITVKSNPTDSIIKDEIIIRGILLDKGMKEPLVDGNIQIKGTQISTITDLDGKFELRIPRQDKNNKTILLASLIGYNSKEIELKPDNTNLQIIIELDGSTMMGDVIIIRHPFLYKIKYKFRNLINRIRD